MKVKRIEFEVNPHELSAWIKKNEPRAAEKLAALSLVSLSTVQSLFNGVAPKLDRTRLQLARAMKRPVDALFTPKKCQKAG